MDDKMFERRLKQLKNSYEQLPTVSSPQTIMEHIQKREVKHSKRTWFHLPYVASFIGVLLIGSILGMQFFNHLPAKNQSNLSALPKQSREQISQENNEKDQQGNNQNNDEKSSSYKVSEKEYKEALKDLSMLYDQMAGDMKEKLHTEEIEHYTFVREAKEKLNAFQTKAKTETKSEQGFFRYWDEHRTVIIQKMSTPDIQYAELERDAKAEDGQMRGYIESRLQSLLEKQNELLPAYQERWSDLQSTIPSVRDIDALLGQLNSTQSQDPEEINEFKLLALGSGYEFYDAGEGMIDLRVNYKGMQEKFHPYLSPAFEQRLDLLSKKKITVDGTLNITFEELGDYIVKLEKTILADSSSPSAKTLYEQYKQALGYYLLGVDNMVVFDSNGVLKEEVKQNYEHFLTTYEDTKTYKVVKPFFEMLKEFKFTNVDEVKKFQINYPVLLKSEETQGESERIDEALSPLPEDLQTIYEQYKTTKDDSLLIGLRPYDVMRFYTQATLEGEYEAIYALYSEDDEAVPPKEKVVEDLKAMGKMDFSYINSIFNYAQESVDGTTATVRLYTRENDFNLEFKLMQGKDHVWKVKWLPMQ
ncbi:hypothetical protein ACFOU2_25805 [Bacillus songklensis]|uniref:Uncharacterized protein n=1 Tax=Bacillus songklensis TaxID=1069116 RepID=A0ABV8BBY0_9BACI